MNFKDKIIDILEKIYCKFFKTKPTKEIRIFIESLLFVFIATGISKGLLFIMNILGGRILGSTTYGEYTLVVSVSAFLAIPVGLGVLGGVLKVLAETDNEKRRKTIISTAIRYIAISTVAFSIIYILLFRQLATVFQIGSNLFLLSIALMATAIGLALYESIIQGLHRQKSWSQITLTTYIISAVAFAFLLINGETGILLLFIPTILINIIFVVIGIYILRKYHSISIFDKSSFRDMFMYGIYVLIITVATTFLGNVDKIMLNFYKGAASVGLYQAYYFSSIMILGVISGVFIKVFFPTAVKLKDPKGMTKKLDKLLLFAVPVVTILTPLIMYVVLFLYNYPFNILTTLIFSLITAINLLSIMYVSLLNAQGEKQIKKMTVGFIFAFLLNIALNAVLIPSLGINGAAIATGISFLFLGIYARIKLKAPKIKTRTHI